MVTSAGTRKGSFSRSQLVSVASCMLMLRCIFSAVTHTADYTHLDGKPPIVYSCLFLLPKFLPLDVDRRRRSFPVADACIWDDLPSSPSLLTFNQRLQCTYLVCPTPVLWATFQLFRLCKLSYSVVLEHFNLK